jgi:hypothetical protein
MKIKLWLLMHENALCLVLQLQVCAGVVNFAAAAAFRLQAGSLRDADDGFVRRMQTKLLRSHIGVNSPITVS